MREKTAADESKVCALTCLCLVGVGRVGGRMSECRQIPLPLVSGLGRRGVFSGQKK